MPSLVEGPRSGRVARISLPQGGAGWDNHAFPALSRPDVRNPPPLPSSTAPGCVVCGFIYDEAAGLPEEGIAPGTRWEDVPDTWTCPDCGVTKDDFEMMAL